MYPKTGKSKSTVVVMMVDGETKTVPTWFDPPKPRKFPRCHFLSLITTISVIGLLAIAGYCAWLFFAHPVNGRSYNIEGDVFIQSTTPKVSLHEDYIVHEIIPVDTNDDSSFNDDSDSYSFASSSSSELSSSSDSSLSSLSSSPGELVDPSETFGRSPDSMFSSNNPSSSYMNPSNSYGWGSSSEPSNKRYNSIPSDGIFPSYYDSSSDTVQESFNGFFSDHDSYEPGSGDSYESSSEDSYIFEGSGDMWGGDFGDYKNMNDVLRNYFTEMLKEDSFSSDDTRTDKFWRDYLQALKKKVHG